MALTASRPASAGYMKLLQEFGFPYHQCVKALNAVHNESLNAALEWLEVHRDDVDDFVDTAPTANLGPPAAVVVAAAPAPTPTLSAPVGAAAEYGEVPGCVACKLTMCSQQ